MSTLWIRACKTGNPALLLLALLIAQSVHGAEPVEPSIRLSFSGNTLLASGINPGGDAIVFACTLRLHSGMRKLGRNVEVVRDADGDGTISFTMTDSAASLWAVIDYTTGRYALATPSGFEPKTFKLHDEGWRGGRAHFELRRKQVEMLVVRPGEGAWTLSPIEGEANDDDGALNAVLRTRLTRMQRIHGADDVPRPPVIVPNDVLVVMDPRTLAFFVSEAK